MNVAEESPTIPDTIPISSVVGPAQEPSTEPDVYSLKELDLSAAKRNILQQLLLVKRLENLLDIVRGERDRYAADCEKWRKEASDFNRDYAVLYSQHDTLLSLTKAATKSDKINDGVATAIMAAATVVIGVFASWNDGWWKISQAVGIAVGIVSFLFAAVYQIVRSFSRSTAKLPDVPPKR